MMLPRFAMFTAAILLVGCGASGHFVALPEDLDTLSVRRETVAMSAEHFRFIPEDVHVKAGTLLTIQITATDGTHGFELASFGIDEKLPAGETRTIRVYLPRKGEYDFSCSHFCGIGHFGMNGKLIVE